MRRRWIVLGLALIVTQATVAAGAASVPAATVEGAHAVSEPLGPVHGAEPSASAGSNSSGGDAEGPAGARWLWPLDPPPRVVRPFEAPPGPYAAGHRGVDLAATPGQAVRAPAGGVVAFAGWVAGREVLSIDHAGGLRTTYEPVRATLTVGSEIRPGEVAGVVTASAGHCLPGTCLHWGLRRGWDYLDPLRMVATGRSVRLLPLRRDDAPATAGPLPQLAAAPSLGVKTAGRDRGPLLAGGR